MTTATIDTELRRVANWDPERDAFVQANDNTRYTYREANEQACQFANKLQERGVQKGDRVAFLSRTSIKQAVTYFGCLKVGAIPAPLHHREAPNVIQAMIEDVRPAVLLYHPAFFEKIGDYVNDLSSVRELVAFRDDPEAEATSLSTFLSGASSHEPETNVGTEDTAFICFSSGTTGTPKGIVHSHEDAIACAHLGQHILNVRRSDVLLNAFTPSFIGWENMIFPFMLAGGTIVLMEKWTPSTVPQTIESEGVTTALFVPTQWKAILKNGDVEKRDLSSFRVAGYAGETMSVDLAAQIREHLTDYFVGDYGTTETHFSGTALFPDQDDLNSIGQPVPRCDVRIVEPDTNDPSAEVEEGDVGELIVRGPSVAEEVWENSEKTDEIFRDGWFFSGDLAKIAESSNIHHLGRTDNMIISGGINIYAEDVEELLEAHPGISECAIVGIPDKEFGEIVKAYAVGDEGLSPNELDEWCQSNDDVSDYQRPKQYEFVSNLPRTNTGKLDRAALRQSK